MSEKVKLASCGSDVKLWEVPGFAMTNSFSLHSQPVSSLCWGNNNQSLVSVGGDKVVVTSFKGDLSNSTELAVGDGYTCAAFNSSSRYLLLGGKTKSLSVWDWKSKSVKKTYKEHKDAVSCLTFNWNDTSIASGALDGTILLHNVITGQASAPLRQPRTQAIRGLQYSYFKKSLLGSVSDDGVLNMWDTNARKLITSFTNDHKAPATGLSFSPVNEMLLVSVGLDKKIVFYDAQGKKSVKVMTAEAPLTSVDFLHDGVTVAVGTTRGKVCIYDLRSGSMPISVQAAHMSSVQCLKFEQSIPSNTKNSVSSSSKVTKSIQSNSKPKVSSRNLPDEPQGTTPQEPLQKPPKQDSPPSQPSSNHTKQSSLKQNGFNEEEDIFSPFKEAKTPMAISTKTDDRAAQPPLVGYDRESLGTSRDKTFDGSGIFSPLSSNSNAPDVRHHPVGGPAYSPTEFQVSKTTTEPSSQATNNHIDPYQRQEDTTTVGSSDRKPKYNDFRDIRGRLDRVSDNTQQSSREPHESSPVISRHSSSNAQHSNRAPHESSPTVSRHSSNSSDIRPWPESDTSRSEGRARLEGRTTDVSMGASGYQGDGSRPMERGKSPRSSGNSPLPHRRRFSSGSNGDRKDGLETLEPPKNSLPYVNGDIAGHGTTGLQPFQIEFIKNMIDDSMDEFGVAIHRDVVNLQVEMLRQFQIQQNELREMLVERYSITEALVQEIDRLREENRRLRTKY